MVHITYLYLYLCAIADFQLFISAGVIMIIMHILCIGQIPVLPTSNVNNRYSLTSMNTATSWKRYAWLPQLHDT